MGRWRDEKHTPTRLYRIWLNMRNRCNNPKAFKYEDYGGRGITIIKEWDDFSKFEEWALSNGYNDSLTIDRINNDLGYYPQNCRWASPKEQANNRRSSVYITHNGETHTMAEWADILDVPYKVFTNRIYRGSSEKTIFTHGVIYDYSHIKERKGK